ncbi:kinase-like protein [Athelia psychrophila]|uniref:Kinase-like protein n=1 Tax=Athelia psychrophila TaxID=1759441 RepID=A0A167XBN3_9AGAM|nr:kinase-like protein [Fibularhizoctonia sp. CBS 109695]
MGDMTVTNQVSTMSGDIFAISTRSDLFLVSAGDEKQQTVFKRLRICRGADITSQRLRQYVERMRHGRLSHPNISRALELCTDGSILGTLMPLYTPGNVIQYLQRYPGSTDRERIDFAADFLKGLAFLHEKDITHDNIRGENIVIDDTRRALLCDAQYKTMVAGDADPPYVHLDSSCRWTAPEKLFNEEPRAMPAPANKAADMYAAGLTIVQMWTLLPPFAHIRRDLAVVVMLKQLVDGTIAAIDRPDKVPVAVWSILKDCLSTVPSLRPSAQALLARIEIIQQAQNDDES